MSNEIEAETIRHLGKVRKPVSPEPIQLTVYSSKVPNLTLVDMPGAWMTDTCDARLQSVLREFKQREFVRKSILTSVTHWLFPCADSCMVHSDVKPSGIEPLP